ncbi:hypothetical protein P7K49_033599 [Saguinus oedipus]|uniref:Uncharacterized protein n=1 Tax=Saguinus oedipus TaxID=9490 RepID=A0ABQ9TSD2_SAGOE|nr:hypothetical protein P7K49_033599 [Saguinus oedipus]
MPAGWSRGKKPREEKVGVAGEGGAGGELRLGHQETQPSWEQGPGGRRGRRGAGRSDPGGNCLRFLGGEEPAQGQRRDCGLGVSVCSPRRIWRTPGWGSGGGGVGALEKPLRSPPRIPCRCGDIQEPRVPAARLPSPSPNSRTWVWEEASPTPGHPGPRAAPRAEAAQAAWLLL